MKTHLPVLLLATVSGGTFSVAQDAAPQSAPVVAPLSRQVDVAPAQRSADDELVELARAAKVNVLADAGDMDAAAPAPARKGFLYGQLNALAKERHLTWLQNGPGTFIAWSQPDALALARKIAASLMTAPAINADATMPTLLPAREPQSLAEELTLFFALPAQGVPGVVGAWKDAPVATLPPALRDRVVFAARAGTVDSSVPADAVWFSDDFWKTARLQIKVIDLMERDANGQSVKKPTSILMVGGSYSMNGRRGVVMRGLGFAAPAP